MLDYRFPCDAAPVQAEGTLDGHPFYFRDRGDYGAPGSFAAGYMALAEARDLIGECVRRYRAERSA